MTNEEVSDWLYRIRSRAEVFMSEAQNAKAKEAVATAINALKKQKTGKWIGIEYDGYADGNPVYDVYECSSCGYVHNGESDTLSDYCPDCGAKMEMDREGNRDDYEEEDDEDDEEDCEGE
jgi:rubrerythrin